MNNNYQASRLVATQSTLKWFVVIGIILIFIGGLILWNIIPFIGIITVGIGIVLVFISLFSLFYLFFTNKVLLRHD